MVDLGVTGTTEAHKVVPCVSAALGNRDFMMHFLCRNKSAFLFATLTKRMLCDVSVSYAFPCTAVLLVDVWGTLVLVVLFPCDGCVLLTVLPVSKVGTAGVRTRSFGSAWHWFTSISGHKKSPRRIAPTKAVLYSLSPL